MPDLPKLSESCSIASTCRAQWEAQRRAQRVAYALGSAGPTSLMYIFGCVLLPLKRFEKGLVELPWENR
jgi:hypothetical protein